VGLARGPAGEVILNPDEEVQARIRLVFEKFREIRSAGGVMRYLRAVHLPLPARPRVGPAPYEVVWQAARTSAYLLNTWGTYCCIRSLRKNKTPERAIAEGQIGILFS
jgi:hypothetical protein